MISHFSLLLPYFAFLLNLSLLINGKKYTMEVDLAFGIYYSETKPAPVVDAGNVIEFLDDVADLITISADTTRIAIVEFGTKEKILLTLKEGEYESNILYAIEDIGEGSYTGPREVELTIAAATTRIRELAFFDKWDRPHVPKLAVLVVEFDVGDWGKSDLYPIAGALGNAVIIVPFAYDSDGMEVFAPANNIRVIDITGFQYGSILRREDISHVDAAESFALETDYDVHVRCNQTKWTGAGCHFDRNDECVADVFYRVDGLSSPSGYPESMSEIAHLYCKKNGSTIPCPTGESVCKSRFDQCAQSGYWGLCNATCDTTGYRIWYPNKGTNSTVNCTDLLPCTIDCLKEDQANEEDTYKHSLKNAMIGLGVAVAVILVFDVFIVLYIWKLTKLKAARQKLATQGAGGMEQSVRMSSISQIPMSIMPPPDVTITPQEDLVKQYAAKMSDRKSAKQRASQKLSVDKKKGEADASKMTTAKVATKATKAVSEKKK